MKTISIILFSILTLLSSSNAGDEILTKNPVYHFNAFTFNTEENYKLVGGGEGSHEICKHLFTPPLTYDGRYIPIPASATVFGVIAVTDGKKNEIIPLFTWIDDKGNKHFGCNGPTIWYARQEDTSEKLLKSIIGAIKK